jgi:hypothetical protein
MNSFNNKWKLAEQSFATYFNGDVVEELELQYKDIDILCKESGKTVSVKDIGDSSKQYGSVLLETTLVNTTNGATSKGSFYKCEADLFAIRLWHKGRYCWYVTHTSELTKYLEQNSLSEVKTRPETEAKNRARGRYYNGTICKRISVPHLVENTECLCIPIRALKNKEQRALDYLRDWGFSK